MQFYQSFFTNLGITHGLKTIVDKKRPNGSNRSFPSGHTSAAFQGAAFIHERYGWKPAVTAYFCATFVAYSRVESKNHYTDDVIAGAIIGTLSSFYFTEPWHGLTVVPTADRGQYGVQLSLNW